MMNTRRLLVSGILLIVLLALVSSVVLAQEEGPPESQNPVALFLAQLTGQDYPAIITLRETYGLGNIARAQHLVSMSDFEGSVLDALAAHQADGGGWGKLYKKYDLHPEKGGLGWAFKQNSENPDLDKPGKGPKKPPGPPVWSNAPENAGPEGKKDKDE